MKDYGKKPYKSKNDNANKLLKLIE